MLIAVVGTGGFGRVAGVLGGSPAALLRVVAERPDQQVVVLTPDHSLATAQRQADLVAAARPSAQVSVLASAHHALTLTLVADRVLESAPWMTGSADFLGAVRTELSTARSLVWSPSAWRLRGVHLSLGVRFRCLVDGSNSHRRRCSQHSGDKHGSDNFLIESHPISSSLNCDCA